MLKCSSVFLLQGHHDLIYIHDLNSKQNDMHMIGSSVPFIPMTSKND